ncbi:MAG: NDP-hexose 2,3-dehydratase family protein [Candidatus Cloacimonetes bacterium]|nr:NDP-hexose 2,3-dehydratase family protein [Candidatus Cloacimonadota bacterium]
MKNNYSYKTLHSEIEELLLKGNINTNDLKYKITNFIESLEDINQIDDFQKIQQWFKEQQKNCVAEVTKIGLKDVRNGWKNEESTGNLVHESGGFFSVIGVDINTAIREVKGGWKQPIVDQGTKSSIIGVVKKNINGIFHYLFEAKFEPGNYGKVLLSPTLQVTYSNLYQAHKGKKPRFAEYFESKEKKYKVIYDHWLPEDGGRFYLKRVKCMIVEIEENELTEIPDSFRWLTLFQVKEMLKVDNLVNPHVRTILSAI